MLLSIKLIRRYRVGSVYSTSHVNHHQGQTSRQLSQAYFRHFLRYLCIPQVPKAKRIHLQNKHRPTDTKNPSKPPVFPKRKAAAHTRDSQGAGGVSPRGVTRARARKQGTSALAAAGASLCARRVDFDAARDLKVFPLEARTRDRSFISLSAHKLAHARAKKKKKKKKRGRTRALFIMLRALAGLSFFPSLPPAPRLEKSQACFRLRSRGKNASIKSRALALCAAERNLEGELRGRMFRR